MLHLAILQQLLAFDSAIYDARRTPGQRTLLLTSEAVGQCLLKRAIAIAKRNIDQLGNAYEPTLISQIGYEIIFNNGSLIQYSEARPLNYRQRYHAVFWQPPAQQPLAAKPDLETTLQTNVLTPGGSLIKVSEAIAQFYARA